MEIEFKKPSKEAFDELDKCANSAESMISHFRKYEAMCRDEGLDTKDINFHAMRRLSELKVPTRTSLYLRKDLTTEISKNNLSDKHENTPELPIGQFDVILADPPWTFDVGGRGAAINHYGVMTDIEIQNLGNKIPIADNAILFLWSTQAMIKKALEVIEAWGFEYHSGFVWVKDKFGTGFFVRGQHELLLISTKGKMPHPEESNRPSSVINADRNQHSKKPDIVYEIIERMYPNREYLELFARKRFSDKWAVWGNQIDT